MGLLAGGLGQAVLKHFTTGSLSAWPLCTDLHEPGPALPGGAGTGQSGGPGQAVL